MRFQCRVSLGGAVGQPKPKNVSFEKRKVDFFFLQTKSFKVIIILYRQLQ